MRKIRITKLDSLFSKKIRERDNWTCVRCKAYHAPPTSALHCSHYWGRAAKSVRYDPLNADALCYGCHSKWESNKQGDYRDFKIHQLGAFQYAQLEKRARSIVKFGTVERKELLELLKDPENVYAPSNDNGGVDLYDIQHARAVSPGANNQRVRKQAAKGRTHVSHKN